MAAGNTYAGGYGSVVEVNTATGGSVIAVSNSQGSTLTLAASDSALSNAAYHVGIGSGVVGRNFTAKAGSISPTERDDQRERYFGAILGFLHGLYAVQA